MMTIDSRYVASDDPEIYYAIPNPPMLEFVTEHISVTILCQSTSRMRRLRSLNSFLSFSYISVLYRRPEYLPVLVTADEVTIPNRGSDVRYRAVVPGSPRLSRRAHATLVCPTGPPRSSATALP
ncbi:hypothetical protein K438DRAFT_1807758 [Mycena galopus ATCC 62051]|nr:hypothetical protein K438DRAFT_1807758 [Mycena galopus ATCC 62051]